MYMKSFTKKDCTVKPSESNSKIPWIPLDPGLVLTDLNTNYWILPFTINPSTEIIIKGEYPFCRYISFTTYGLSKTSPVLSAYDTIILPDNLNTNPFLPRNNFVSPQRNYTLTLKFTPPVNELYHYVPSSSNNTFYLNISPEGKGFLVYRLCVPSMDSSNSGGVSLPEVTIKDISLTLNETNNRIPGNSNFFDLLKIVSNKITPEDPDIYSSPQENECSEFLVWRRASKSLLPVANPLTIYMYSLIKNDPNKFLYIYFKAPTFPDTYNYNSITGHENMRYFSMSIGRLMGMKGVLTVSDYNFIIKNGYIKLVIGFGAPKPSYITEENGFTYIELKDKPANIILYRNTLFGGFPFVAKDIKEGEVVPEEALEKYYPVARYFPVDISEEDFIDSIE